MATLDSAYACYPGRMFILLFGLPLIHLVAYTTLLRFGFGLTWLRAGGVALARECLGSAFYFALLPGTVFELTFATTLLISAPLAWLLVTPLDPNRSWRRTAQWVTAGSACSIVINFMILSSLVGPEFFRTNSLRLIPG